ncbi:MAG TPA: hypothetical protein VIB01_07720 [Steroidobacteraceae bacterium]|jgi:hypothetical protein
MNRCVALVSAVTASAVFALSAVRYTAAWCGQDPARVAAFFADGGEPSGGTGVKVKISGFEEWTIGPDGLIAASLGHFDADDYDRQLRK